MLAEGVPHEVLNAKHHSKEAAIVAQAGRLGAVTVATNIAGRGTDIILGGNAEYWGQSQIESMGIAVRYSDEWEKVEDFVKQICIGNEDQAPRNAGRARSAAKVPRDADSRDC